MNYACVYLDMNDKEKTVFADAILYLKDGFWINEHGKFTTGSDNLIWIPPSRILFIRKYNG